MALKPTIYKFRIALSDLGQGYYDTLTLTVAQHPSETVERMLMRVLAYCLHASDSPEFTQGLCVPDQPDLWSRADNNTVQLWIEVGEPDPERIKKATRQARLVKVYSFNTKSRQWWTQHQAKFQSLPAQIYRCDWHELEAMAQLIDRTNELSITLSDDTIYLANERGHGELNVSRLQPE